MSWSYEPGFVGEPEAAFERIRAEVAWTAQMASRQTASMGIPYNYAGASYPENPWTPTVAAIRGQVAARVGWVPTNCLLNRYPSGEHTIGWHRDDTEILAPGTGIAIVSLGAVRTMQLRRGDGPDFDYSAVVLEPGSLLLMSAELQHDHKHRITREPGAGERISLSFRALTHAPPPVDRPRWGA